MKSNLVNTAQWIMKTPVGNLYLAASDQGLLSVSTDKLNSPLLKSLDGNEKKFSFLKQAVSELNEYFRGKRKTFTIQLDTQGTAFQKSVWNELKKIPYGKTCSYTDIAKKINNEKAVRAVGSANGKNQFFIIVPCHRVVTASGALGGYAGGIKMKKDLLAFERQN